MSGEYIRIPNDQYQKLLFQTRGQFIAILSVFNCHGLEVHVQGAIDECMKVTENFGMAVRGKDKPIHILNEPKRRGV
tara:strand:- start:30340 stop:30570 length:231 start_codon:yes stop_codon:yes gene_type:complete